MGRFLLLWLLLAPVYGLGRIAVSLLFFRRMDLRFVTFCELLFVPAFQAALFCLLEPDSGRLRTALSEASRSRTVAIVAAGNLVLALLAVLSGPDSWARVWLRPVTGLQAGGAGLLLLTVAARPSSVRGDRLLLGAGVVALWAWGAAAFAGTLSGLSDRVLPAFPQALRWLTVYGAIFAALLVILLALGRVLGRHSNAAGLLLELAVALALAAAAIVVPNVFLRPIVPEPWATVAGACGLLSSGAVLAAVIEAHAAVRRATPAGALAPSAPA